MLNRITRCTLLILACMLMHSTVAQAQAEMEAAAPTAHRVRFAFHSSFLLNLHHFLFDAAVHPDKLDRMAWLTPPGTADLQTLRDAATVYRAHYAKHSLLFDTELASIKQALSGDDARQDVNGLSLPHPVATALTASAPIYAKCIWASDDRTNHDWISQTQALDAQYGAAIQAGIEQGLAHPFPDEVVRVDAVVETGDRNGAYTTEEPPHSIIPSGRADYQGLAALEMLYHEASHVHVTDTLSDAIDAEITATHRPRDQGLWHAVQFYTVGSVVQNVLRQQGQLNYQPYAEKNGVYQGKWAPYRPLIEQYWRPYLRGETPLSEAIKAMVDQLPAT